MEPKLPAPNLEHSPTPVNNPEFNRENSGERRVETTPERGLERGEPRGESQPLAPAVTLPAPISVPTPVAVSDDNAVVDDGTPAVANDDDLIEKEWVDKAKQIISRTRDDPYRREQEVSRLQVDYLRKRYGKELGAS